MKYGFLGFTLLCNYAAADCDINSKLPEQVIIQSGSETRTAAQEGFFNTGYKDKNYCLLLKNISDDTSIALIYNKNNNTHNLIPNFKKINSSPDNNYTAVFSSEPYNDGKGKQHIYLFNENGIANFNGKINDRVDSEQYKMFFTADSKKFIIHTNDDYMKFFYSVNLPQLVMTKNDSSSTVRSKVRDLGIWITDFRIIDDNDILVTLEDNSIIYYSNTEVLWKKQIDNEQKFRVLSIGSKYVVTVAADDSIHYFNRRNGSEFKVLNDKNTEFSLYERLDPNDVRWVAENKLVAIINIDGKDRVFYFDFTSQSITEERS